MKPLVIVSNISKRFGLTIALRELSLVVSTGQTLAFVGDNGAGKSTLLSLISGLLRPDSGSIELMGACPNVRRDYCRIASRVGVLQHQALLYSQLSVEQNLRLFASLFGVAKPGRVTESLELFGILPLADRQVSELSQGMLKRVALSRVFLHRPELLLLDEPFAHLDIEWKERVAQLLNEHGRAGGTTLFSSHEPELIRKSGAEVVPLKLGRIVVDANAPEVIRHVR